MIPEAPEALRVLLLVVEALERAGLEYHVGGSFASSVHGVPRQTQDIDLVVDLSPNLVEDLVQSLSKDFFVQTSAAHEAVRDRRSFNAIHLATGLKIDFFIRGDSPFDLEEFKRHRAQPLLEERPIIVKSLEDIVLRKLERAGSEISDRQWGDVIEILRAQEESLDQTYLAQWAATLGVADLLEKALKEC